MLSYATLITALLAGFSAAAPSCQVGISAQRKAKAKSTFSNARLIPGIVASSWDPKLELIPIYNNDKIVNFGNKFSTVETTMAPKMPFDAEPGFDPKTTNYTLLIVDPDVPSPAVPADPLKFFLHMGVYDVHPNPGCGGKGMTLKTYRPYEALTPGSVEAHRYTFLAYRQPRGVFTPTPTTAQVDGTMFDLQKFVSDNRLTLVGGNFLLEGISTAGSTG